MINFKLNPWLQTFLGVKFYLFNPHSSDIFIEDIAHALAYTCRYNGHSKNYYSVAEHCVLMSRFIASDNTKLGLYSLLHDAAEAYVGDLISPIKDCVEGFHEIEDNILKLILYRFDLKPELPRIVKELDGRILSDERKKLFTYQLQWSRNMKPLGCSIKCWNPLKAEKEFLKQFNLLNKKLSNG